MRNLLILITFLIYNTVQSQVVVKHFNAEWNNSNAAAWVDDLSDCDVTHVDIVKDPTVQGKYNVVVVPTIIVFNEDGEEVKRWQADLSFKIGATKKDVQEYIDELIMSSF
tara:strand:+ start:2533 stop:2862 length:330 start_codon:yes stop_codon:yes gene_type:complete